MTLLKLILPKYLAEQLIHLGVDRTIAGLVVSNSPDTPNTQAQINQCSEELFKAKGLELVEVDMTQFCHPDDLQEFYAILRDISSERSS